MEVNVNPVFSLAKPVTPPQLVLLADINPIEEWDLLITVDVKTLSMPLESNVYLVSPLV